MKSSLRMTAICLAFVIVPMAAMADCSWVPAGTVVSVASPCTVGVGTPSPQGGIHVLLGSVGVGQRWEWAGAGSTNAIDLTMSNGNGVMPGANSAYLSYITGAADFGIRTTNTGAANFVINSAGLVGIGTGLTQPQGLLHLKRSAPGVNQRWEWNGTGNTNAMDFTMSNGNGVMPNSNSAYLSYITGPADFGIRTTAAGTANFLIDSTGNVVVGTNSPDGRLMVQTPGVSQVEDALRLKYNNNTPNSGMRLDFAGLNSTSVRKDYAALTMLISSNASGTESGILSFATMKAGALGEAMRIDNNGNVGIGMPNPAYALDVNGTIHATNVIGASYQDLAEWVPASSSMAPGTVVVLNQERTNEVVPSSTEYDVTVAGVVSAKPGIVLGESSPDKAQVATTGRVKVKVDASKDPIKIGDLLVTSDVRGTAMKSEPMEINGRRFHQPGTIIGKALEPLESGTGEILVLLSLQ